MPPQANTDYFEAFQNQKKMKENWEKQYQGMMKSFIREREGYTKLYHLNNELQEKVKQLEAQVEELKKLKEQTEEQTLAKLFKKMLE